MANSHNILRQSALFVLVGLFGALAGFLVAAGNGITLDGHDHSTDHEVSHSEGHGAHKMRANAANSSDNSAHKHGMPIALKADGTAPTVSIQLHPDPVAGYNLQIETTNFRFSGARSGLNHQEGEGHAHLYFDGVKHARLYGNWTHLAKLPDGASQLTVSLNSNDHRALSVNGTIIEAHLALDTVR